MRFAVNMPPFTSAQRILALIRAADDAGWDAVFLWDHLRWRRPGLDVHDPWVLLGAAAAVTERIRLGTCVTPLARRRPQVVAKQLTTLDHLSGGRAVLGVGLGEPPDADFADFGDEPDPRVRAARLDEGLTVLDGLLRGERVEHDGEHLRVHAEVLPLPVQRPRPPIFVAGVLPHRRPLARALRHDGYFPIGAGGAFVTPDELAAHLDGVTRPAGWELYASRHPDHPAADVAAVGVDWLVEGAWPEPGWDNDLEARIIAGPQR